MPYKDREKRREASKRHYRANKDEYKKRAKQHAAKQKIRARAVILEAKSVACMDCRETFPPICMDFDHRDRVDKFGNIGDAIKSGWGLKRLMAEIEKCDVVCANCHRLRTFD